MQPILDRLFDLREKEKQAEIKRISEQLKQLRTKLEERNKNKKRSFKIALISLPEREIYMNGSNLNSCKFNINKRS